jgi:hypothetical protein
MSFLSDRKLKSRMGALKDPAAFWDSDLTAHANVGAVTPIEQKKRGLFGRRKSKGISSAAVNDAAAARPGDGKHIHAYIDMKLSTITQYRRCRMIIKNVEYRSLIAVTAVSTQMLYC